MAANLNPNEEAQLLQTIEMFEVIAQSQPNDYQSLEILKEAYSKLGRTDDVIAASKRIARAYEEAGQLFSAILEYESILELNPDDKEVKAALAVIVSKGENFGGRPPVAEPEPFPRPSPEAPKPGVQVSRTATTSVEDGRETMRKIFVEGKVLNPNDFDKHWFTPNPLSDPIDVQVPFIQTLSELNLVPLEQSLKLVCERSRLCFLSLDRYDIDVEWVRKMPAGTKAMCYRWCILPFDRMSKTVMVATANPFNQRAAEDLANLGHDRVLWYLTPPADLVRLVKKTSR